MTCGGSRASASGRVDVSVSSEDATDVGEVDVVRGGCDDVIESRLMSSTISRTGDVLRDARPWDNVDGTGGRVSIDSSGGGAGAGFSSGVRCESGGGRPGVGASVPDRVNCMNVSGGGIRVAVSYVEQTCTLRTISSYGDLKRQLLVGHGVTRGNGRTLW